MSTASQEIEKRVNTQWTELCSALKVDVGLSQKWWKIVREHYCESWRYYHTLSHVHHMLDKLTAYEDKLKNPKEVALAVYFHDVIYDPRAGDNEEQSAVTFEKFAEECLCSGSEHGVERQRVCEMIMLTKKHQTPAHMAENEYGDSDEHYLLDFDMAILGEQSSEYRLYSANIQREYAHIPNKEYCRRRAHVLKEFLGTRRIYCTEVFHEKYEENAKKNILNEIASLSNN